MGQSRRFLRGNLLLHANLLLQALEGGYTTLLWILSIFIKHGAVLAHFSEVKDCGLGG